MRERIRQLMYAGAAVSVETPKLCFSVSTIAAITAIY